jgi:tetratricopeptide (TPR) repeat protein
MNKWYQRPVLWVFSLLIAALLGPETVLAQKKLSRKERVLKEKEMMADRLFIEGQKQLMLEEYEKAYFYFTKALEFNEEEPAVYFKLSEMMVRANQPEKALEYGQQALALDPDNKYYHLQLAEIYNGQNKSREAAEILEKLMEKDGNYQQYILDLASLYLTLNEFDKALDALDKAEDYFGVVEQLTAQKQRIYLRKNNLPMAIKEGQKLIEAHPGNANYVLALVEILFNNNRTDQALELVLESIATYPNQPELKMAAHTLYKEKRADIPSKKYLLEGISHPDLDASAKARAFSGILGQLQHSARDQWLDTLAFHMENLHPQDPEILEALGNWKLQQRETKAAISYFKRSLQEAPDNAELYQTLVPLMFEAQEPFEAIVEMAGAATESAPESAELWFYLGTAQLGNKENEAAKAALNKALVLNAGANRQLLLMANAQLGDALHALGEKEAAFEAYEKVLAENKNYEHILNNYAYFLSLEKKELEKAYQMSFKLVNRFPENPTYLDTHAWVLFQQGRYGEAKGYMERALDHQKDPSGVMFEHYGDILYKLGEKEQALSYWIKAKEMEDTSEFLTLKIQNKTYYE